MDTCPYCGSSDVEYDGVDDGGGDFADSAVEMYHCHDCGETFDFDPVAYWEAEPPDIPEPTRWTRAVSYMRWRAWQLQRVLQGKPRRLTDEELPF